MKKLKKENFYNKKLFHFNYKIVFGHQVKI